MGFTVDIVTLDNFESKMPSWDPAAPNHLQALVDMGSNGIRFSISDLSPPRARLLKCVYRERAAISLFDDLNATGAPNSDLNFSTTAIHLVAQTLARFRSIALDYGVPLNQISVFATEAMRRASNAASILDAIKEAAPGLSVHILAPEVETLFGSVGARSSFVDVKGLFLDLGGGSVQMTYMDSSSKDLPSYAAVAAQIGQSMPFGAAQLSSVLGSSDSKLKSATKGDLQSQMLAAFGKLCARFPDLAKAARADRSDAATPGVDIYLCGGGFRGYGSMLMHNDPIQPYPIPLIGAYTVSGDQFKKTDKMRKVNKKYDQKIFGMSKRRRDQFPAIATVVEALVGVVPNINTVTFCSGGNREGALMMKLPKEVREANPLHLSAPLDGVPSSDPGVVQALVDAIYSAVPTNITRSSIISLIVVPVLVQRIWERCGEDGSSNSTFVLHDAIQRDPSIPGLNHLGRACLAISLWARWGASLAPVDKEFHKNLQLLMGGPSSEEYWWAQYIGATAAAIATVFPAQPRTAGCVKNSIKFESARQVFGSKVEIHTSISIASSATQGLDLQEVKDCFKLVGKDVKDSKKVVVSVQEFSDETTPQKPT